MAKKILFVDDEPNILQGLQRMLRGMRQEWDMAFASGGEEALETLSKSDFDVVVTDMRMPGIDGAHLLQEVTNRHPQIIRIILSGQSDREKILASIELAHRYLAKPCDAEALKRAISGALAMREKLTSQPLQKLVAQLKSLPSLPSLYLKMMEMMDSPNSSLVDIGKVIEQDMSMTAKILHLVNSPFFGQPKRISSPSHAVSFLGLDMIRALVLSVHIFGQISENKMRRLKLSWLWDHSMLVGAVARDIARAEGRDRQLVDDAFMAGILHDVGIIILADNMTEQYEDSLSLARKTRIPIEKAEKSVFGATHAEVGGYLLGLWGLPDSIIEAVSYHLDPENGGSKAFSPLTAVHVADCIGYRMAEYRDEAVNSPVNESYISGLGLAKRIPAWEDICAQAVKRLKIHE